MKLQIGAYDENDKMVEDWSPIGRAFVISSGSTGAEVCTGLVRRSRWETAYWWDRRGQYFVRAHYAGATLFDGRLEDVATVEGGMQVTALGSFRAYTDIQHTRLWSAKGYANWEPVTALDLANYEPAVFEIDNNNRLFIGPLEGQTFGTTNERGGLVFKMPHNGEADAKLIQFKFTADLPTNWRARLFGYDEGFTSETSLWTQDGTGAPVTGAVTVSLSTPQPYIVLALYRITSSVAFAADNATSYIELTDVRISSTDANDVNTTLGTSILAGSQVVTPGSMVNIYVGQKLAISGATSEQVVVTAVTATTFTATYASGHSNTDSVRAIYVSAEEIAASLVGSVAAVNPDQVDSSTALIEATDRDLLNASWEDALPADILIELAASHNFEVGVGSGRTLYFRPRGAEARTWYVDASVALERTLEAVHNSAYAVYADDKGRLLRTDVTADGGSLERYGITRRAAVFVDTSSETLAEGFRDDFLTVNAEPEPRASVFFNRVFTETGVPVPLFFVTAGDYLVARNVSDSPQFLISRAEYFVDTNELLVEPVVRPPTIAEALAQGLKGEETARRQGLSFRQKPRVL